MNLSIMSQDSHFMYCKNYSKTHIIEFVKKIIEDSAESRRYTKEAIQKDDKYKFLLSEAKKGHEARIEFLKYQEDSKNDIDKEKLDSEIQNSPINFGTGAIIFHGMKKPDDFKLEKGFLYTFNKYLSCSLFPFASADSATNYNENNNSTDRIILILETKHDIKCIMGSASDNNVAGELEVLLPRNIQIQVKSISEPICNGVAQATSGEFPDANFYIIEATIFNT